MTINQTPFDTVLVGIVSGRYKAGGRLVERDLVAELGVSRTPVREAIRKLESFGLVRCLPHRGAVVTELSPTDIEALYFVRLHQERLAAKLSFYHLGPDDIEELKEINRELQLCHKNHHDLFELIQKDREFHQAIYRASRNDFLIRIIDDLRLKCYTIAYYAWRDRERVKLSIEEHKDIIKALKQKDRAWFQRLIEHRLLTAKSFYSENAE